MFSDRDLPEPSLEPKDPSIAAYDADGAEIYHGGRTVVYEDRELVWESFKEEIESLLSTESGVFTLAEALDLEITRYD